MAYDSTSRVLAAQALLAVTPSIEQFGAQSSTVVPPYTNTKAFLNAFATGPAKIALAGDYFPVAAIAASEAYHLHWVGQQPAIMIPRELKALEGRGATLALGATRGIVAAPSASYNYPEINADLAADVAAGDTTLTLASGQGANWSAGDAFLYRLGSLPYDLPEPLLWGFAKVRGVSGDVLTIDAPMPASFAISSVSAQTFTDAYGTTRTNKTIYKWPLLTDLAIRDVSIAGNPAGNTEIALHIQGGQRIAVNNVAVRNTGMGIALQYVVGGVLDGCSMTNSSQPGNLSLNKGVGLAECRAIEIRQFVCTGVKYPFSAEANSQAVITGGTFHNTGNPASGASYGAQCTVFAALGLSQLTVRDFTVTGYGGYVLSEIANGTPAYNGQIRFEGRLTLIHDTMPAGLGRLREMDCLLDLRIAGTRELWDFTQTRWFTRRIWLRGGMNQSLLLPPGILRQARVYASPGVLPGANLTALYVGRTGDNGNDCSAQIVAGQSVLLNNTDDGSILTRRGEQLKLLVVTAAGAALDASSEYLDVECELVPNLLAPAILWSNSEDERVLGPGLQPREALFSGTNLPSIAAGATLQSDFAVPAMALGDFITSVSLGIDRAGISIRDTQCLSGLCRIVFENRTAAAIDLAAASLRILWAKSTRP